MKLRCYREFHRVQLNIVGFTVWVESVEVNLLVGEVIVESVESRILWSLSKDTNVAFSRSPVKKIKLGVDNSQALPNRNGTIRRFL